MGIQDSGKDERERLGFAEAVLKHIEPVIVPLGFRRTGVSRYAVMYESPEVFMQVIHDPRSYDIDVEFWRVACPSERCALGGLLALKCELRRFQASTRDRVATAMADIADLLRRLGTEALTGDPKIYQLLVKNAKDRSKVYTKEGHD